MNKEGIKVGDEVKIKNPSLPYQSSIRYNVVKTNKTTCWLSLKEDKNIIYKGIPYNVITKSS